MSTANDGEIMANKCSIEPASDDSEVSYQGPHLPHNGASSPIPSDEGSKEHSGRSSPNIDGIESKPASHGLKPGTAIDASHLTPSRAASLAARDPTLATLAPVQYKLKDIFLPKSSRHRSVVDLDSVATQPSVFDDPTLREHYWPSARWENFKNWDVALRWTWREEREIVRIIDRKVLIWVCVFFAILNLDRNNLSAANTDGFLTDLKLSTNDFNTATMLFRIAFLCAELPGQIISKRVGPDVFVPCQIIAWGAVTLAQFWTKSRTTFFIFRTLLGVCQGSMIPDLMILLSYFYVTSELPIRLALFWATMNLVSFVSSYFSYGVLQMRGIQGKAGWRWLFLVEGLITLVVGVLAFLTMTKRVWSKRPWLNERQTKIAVARVLRDEPRKSSMHNRQGMSVRMILQTLANWRLWPIYILGISFGIPVGPPQQYLTLSLRKLGFSVLLTQTLSSLQYLIAIFTGIGIVIVSEIVEERSFVSATENIWALPFLIALLSLRGQAGPWTYFGIATTMLGAPYAHPIMTSWVSANAGDVQTRAMSASLYNMSVQLGSVIISQIYRADDAPQYNRGNAVLVAICVFNLLMYTFTKYFYKSINKRRERIWDQMSVKDKDHYLASTKDEGNKRLDFRFLN